MDKTRNKDREAAEVVLRYFLENPRAAADLESVSRWRLLRYETNRIVDETARALHWLVSRRELLLIEAPGLAPQYRLNPDREAAARPSRRERRRRRANES